MFVLVTFAVDAEFAPWRELRRFRKVKVNANHYSGGADVYETQVGDCCVWVSLTGMGIKFFNFETAMCLRSAGLDAVISSGLSGALKSSYRIGQIIVPRRVGNLRDAVGLPTTAQLNDLAERQGATLVETLLTSDRIIDSHQDKSRLAQFGDAVDMESFHVVRRFLEPLPPQVVPGPITTAFSPEGEGVPVVVIRAVSDAASEDLPLDFSKVLTTAGQVRVAPLVKELMSRPAQIPHLIQFAKQSREAAKNLVQFLDVFLRALTPAVIRGEARTTAAAT
jgi:nucleoside phosphorylase